MENLSLILEQKLSTEDTKTTDILETSTQNSESAKFMKMLYRTLLDNEVNERYVNQILDEAEKVALRLKNMFAPGDFYIEVQDQKVLDYLFLHSQGHVTNFHYMDNIFLILLLNKFLLY